MSLSEPWSDLKVTLSGMGGYKFRPFTLSTCINPWPQPGCLEIKPWPRCSLEAKCCLGVGGSQSPLLAQQWWSRCYRKGAKLQVQRIVNIYPQRDILHHFLQKNTLLISKVWSQCHRKTPPDYQEPQVTGWGMYRTWGQVTWSWKISNLCTTWHIRDFLI